MKFVFVLTLAVVIVGVYTADTTDHSMNPAYYQCPFKFFNGGMPVTNELGEVLYCDEDGVQCPQWHFCSYGYDDNRSVCCHILGV